MRSAVFTRVDRSVALSAIASGAFLAACGTSRGFARCVMLAVHTAWLYLSNNQG
jgi:hypothetical protein